MESPQFHSVVVGQRQSTAVITPHSFNHFPFPHLTLFLFQLFCFILSPSLSSLYNTHPMLSHSTFNQLSFKTLLFLSQSNTHGRFQNPLHHRRRLLSQGFCPPLSQARSGQIGDYGGSCPHRCFNFLTHHSSDLDYKAASGGSHTEPPGPARLPLFFFFMSWWKRNGMDTDRRVSGALLVSFCINNFSFFLLWN